MKIQIASDLHTEFWGRQQYDILDRVSKTDADVIVLAGDIGSMRGGPPTWLPHVSRLLDDRNVPIIKISGNHDYYSGCIEDVDDMHMALTRQSDGMFISANPGVVELGGITFVMATLWAASYATPGERHDCEYSMNDYKLIRTKAPKPGEENETELFLRRFQIEDSERLNGLHTAFIFDRLSEMSLAQRQRTVVVTHHTPSARSIKPAYRNSSLNGCYHNHFDGLLEKFGPTLWIHGHTHGSADYTIGNTRVVSNPQGYPPRGGGTVFENPNYNTGLVVEV